MGIEALVGGSLVSGLGSGAINYAANERTNAANKEMQEAANRWNEQLTRESWAREDNARQRAVKDMLAAGLNPNLAAGSPAATSGAARMEASRNIPNTALGDALGGLAKNIASAASVDATMAQANLTRSAALTEAEKPAATRAQASRDMATAAKSYADAGYKKEATRIVKKDADLWVKQGVDVRDRDVISKTMKNFPGVVDELKKQTKDSRGYFKNPLLPPYNLPEGGK